MSTNTMRRLTGASSRLLAATALALAPTLALAQPPTGTENG